MREKESVEDIPWKINEESWNSAETKHQAKVRPKCREFICHCDQHVEMNTMKDLRYQSPQLSSSLVSIKGDSGDSLSLLDTHSSNGKAPRASQLEHLPTVEPKRFPERNKIFWTFRKKLLSINLPAGTGLEVIRNPRIILGLIGTDSSRFRWPNIYRNRRNHLTITAHKLKRQWRRFDRQDHPNGSKEPILGCDNCIARRC